MARVKEVMAGVERWGLGSRGDSRAEEAMAGVKGVMAGVERLWLGSRGDG